MLLDDIAMQEKTDVIECTDTKIILINSYSLILTTVHNILFCFLILFGIFLVAKPPANLDSFQASINLSGFLLTTLKGNPAILSLKLAGLFFILLSTFALSVKKPNLVTFIREQAKITISGRSWFGIVPYQEVIPFNQVVSKNISKNHSAVILPLKSGKMVFIGNISELKVIDAIIAIVQCKSSE
ncbi:hypothetical protein H6G41_11285 [Tolypothrix sp. FACHB-123]|uniref:hypothetical protein n=1 Tax=Tolypothrix sp. FACHB-123 TaxID=2692868 RepID=UPI001686E210|nr:hypothetical protein [Tolypothrix sp. FACHB-123]MBD2355197.1 hypothetical protein [Tolypothrix sp. FACHB-123]